MTNDEAGIVTKLSPLPVAGNLAGIDALTDALVAS